MKKIRIIHYLNQFFGGIGGEDKADTPPAFIHGSKGPGSFAQDYLGSRGEIVATIICGDDYFNEKKDDALREIMSKIEQYSPDLLIAGPAFGAGRYGLACGIVCSTVHEKLKIPVITGMHLENPAVELFRDKIPVVITGLSAKDMSDALKKMVDIGCRLCTGERIKSPVEEGLIGSGIRKNVFAQESAAERAVNMLVAKLKGLPYITELPVAIFDRIAPARPLTDLKNSTIALVTTGGIVPKGNPDRISAGRSNSFGKYMIKGNNDLKPEEYQAVHAGYDTKFADDDPDRVVPLDAMRRLEKNGIIGKLYDYFYTLSGQGTYVQSAKKIGREIGEDLLRGNVNGVILTST